MNVLVTGGTGFIGTHLCRELAARGHDVTALSRSPDDTGVPEGVGTATGDVTAYDSIEGAFAGQDAVVNLVALSPLFKPKGGDETHFEVHLEGTRNVVEAAEAHGVEKLVQLSALGADPEGETAYVRAKGQAEDVVRDSDLAWTIFRPSVVFGEGGEFVSFTETLTTPYVTALPGGGKTRFQPLWVGDLVEMIGDALTGHDGETYEVGGPEVLTLADVAKAVYRAKGQSLTVLSVPMGLAKVGMTLADPLPFVPFGGDQYRSLRFDNTVAENDVTAFGRDPADLKRLTDYLG
ncbi:complex I NDUFA9 subunit family protein [Halarchaeum salinum]|uniref:Complex I NDUFA9 subunit family protein n=1 Tax=Halarchaeum salinum TaxID=489912 RepID=A0AAV3S6K9_9EURY